MRKVTCIREGCKIGPKMGKETQVGAGVLRLAQSYLVPFKLVPSSTKLSKSRIRKKVSKAEQTGAGVMQNIESKVVVLKPTKLKNPKAVQTRVSKAKKVQKGKDVSKTHKRPIVVSSLELIGSKRRCVKTTSKKVKPKATVY